MTSPTLNLAEKKHAMGFVPGTFSPKCGNCHYFQEIAGPPDVPRCLHVNGGFSVSSRTWCPRWEPSEEWRLLPETRIAAEILHIMEMAALPATEQPA